MSNLALFQFESDEVRVVMVDGEPWFVLRDVLRAMGTKTRPADAKAESIETLGEGVVKDYPLQTPGGMQEVTIVSTEAVTFLVSRGRTETSKRLNRWIHCEVLPSIRKTGSYTVPTISDEMEMLRLQNEGQHLQVKSLKLQKELMQFRHLVVTTCPEPVQQKILGYETVKEVEYVDRVISHSGETFDGVGITAIQKRYGFKTTKAARQWLEAVGVTDDHWHNEPFVGNCRKLPRELLSELDEVFRTSDRQQFLGE